MQRMYENINSGLNTDNPDCGKKAVSALPEFYSVAMAYIPFQISTQMYSEEKALCAGTLFPVLDKPFLGSGCR